MDTITTARKGAVATITLNRPESLNAFNETMHRQLTEALDAAADDKAVRAVMITGAGRAFSAGQDLSDRRMGDGAAPPDLGETLDTLYNPLVRRLRAYPVPTLAAINGVAAGASLNIALACDVVVASDAAIFLEPFANLGLVPDAGGTFTLPRAVGTVRARAMMMLAEKIDAETALAWGLVYRTFPHETFREDALALAGRLAQLPTAGLIAIRTLIDDASATTLDRQLDAERDVQRERGQSADYGEGVRAFLDKRAPRFSDRM